MKINYSILWLDDSIDEFVEDGWIDNIKQYLIEEGFEPKVTTVAKIDEFYSELNASFDLIMTDFHMTPKNGDEIVKDIRNQNIQTEILFYTAREDLQEIGKIDRVTFLETTGDHHSQIVEATKDLIALTIKKFQNIIAMRGMIMHETSSLDNQTAKILSSYMELNKADTDVIISSICVQLEELLKSKQNVVTGVKNGKNYTKLTKDNFLFSAEYKIESLKFILDKLSLFDFTDDYKKEVSNLRNKFAHAVLETDETGRQYFKGGEDGITFNEDLCRTIRKNINKHKKYIDDLESKLKEKNTE
jgi:CheY-like chemotaxis protein